MLRWPVQARARAGPGVALYVFLFVELRGAFARQELLGRLLAHAGAGKVRGLWRSLLPPRALAQPCARSLVRSRLV